MGTEAAYPIQLRQRYGDVDGFDIDVGNLLCSLADLDRTWVKNDWDSIIPNLVAGNYDTIMAGMSITAERDEIIDFSEGYLPWIPASTLLGRY